MSLTLIIITTCFLLMNLWLGVAMQKSGLVDPKQVILQMQCRSMELVKLLLVASITSLTVLALLDITGLLIAHATYTLPIVNIIGGLMIGGGLVIVMAGPARCQEGELGWAGIAVFVAVLAGIRYGIKAFFVVYPDIYHRVFVMAGEPTMYELMHVPFWVASLVVIVVMVMGLKVIK